MSKLENYIFGQGGKSLYTYLRCKGSSELIRHIKEYMEDKELNDNQLQLISEYATEKEQKLLKYYQNQPQGSFNGQLSRLESAVNKGGDEK